ncbi:nucleotide-diphospho-sugar transferase [Mycena galericulata]|nr:nucleotide-diphospho-sugar transferase [Mycena galericulata]
MHTHASSLPSVSSPTPHPHRYPQASIHPIHPSSPPRRRLASPPCHRPPLLTLPPLLPVWSSFEIADIDFSRGEIYTKFSEFLDNTDGFTVRYHSIDAPVPSIAAGISLPKSKIHFFNKIGYVYTPNRNCPKDDDVWCAGMCSCEQLRSHGEWLRVFHADEEKQRIRKGERRSFAPTPSRSRGLRS